MAITLQTIINAASQGVEGGQIGQLQIEQGVKSTVDTVLNNLKTKVSDAGTGIGNFLSRIGLGGLAISAAKGAQAGSSQQESSLISDIIGALPTWQIAVIIASIAVVVWVVLRKK